MVQQKYLLKDLSMNIGWNLKQAIAIRYIINVTVDGLKRKIRKIKKQNYQIIAFSFGK